MKWRRRIAADRRYHGARRGSKAVKVNRVSGIRYGIVYASRPLDPEVGDNWNGGGASTDGCLGAPSWAPRANCRAPPSCNPCRTLKLPAQARSGGGQ